MARKKRAVRRASYSGHYHSDHTHSSPSQSPTHSSPPSPPNPSPDMARTKTTARRPGVAPRPSPPPPPNTSQPSSSKPNSSRGKRPLHEDEENPPTQTRHTRDTIIDFHRRPVGEPRLSNLFLTSSFMLIFLMSLMIIAVFNPS
ncbi:proline-rich receptor-like protein kinase PERK10 [Arachis stenosperma]|uniref:proline-rich receptor-like protein kinase PERK10 n=1 Tax=Arachis stenosperma TaxID=217475 RepID=UPI0025ACAF64|nr:proline-rich receptor-like protein kinase PERK10 [Arachis stenosperma]